MSNCQALQEYEKLLGHKTTEKKLIKIFFENNFLTYFHDIVSNAEILSTLISLVPGVLLHKSNQDFSIILVFNAESVLREKKKDLVLQSLQRHPSPPPPHLPVSGRFGTWIRVSFEEEGY